jgi:hypothetical protein
MRDELTIHDIAADARMTRAAFPGTILILEGGSDLTALRSFVDYEACAVTVAHGKWNVLAVVSLLEADLLGIVGIVDADFDRLENSLPSSPNILVADFHDRDLMIFASPALEKVLTVRALDRKIRSFEAQQGATIREIVLKNGAIVGIFLWMSVTCGLGLNFKDLKFKKFVGSDLSIDIEKLVDLVVQNSPSQSMSRSELAAKIRQKMAIGHEPLELCRGHDAIEILAICMQKKISALNQIENTAAEIGRSLSLAYERSHFETSYLYDQVRNWEARNSPYRVLYI